MTKAEAETECKRLAAEHADRETHRWIPREGRDGEWTVVKVGLPPVESNLAAETRADEKPPTGNDPRTWRDVGPSVGGGF